VVTLAFAGDSHFQLNLSTLLDRPRGALGPISDLLADADLTMLNLESAISADGSWDPKELETPSRRYFYRTPARALDVLADAGVDLVSVANNHGADAGPEGLADTLRAQAHGPIPVLGVGRTRAAAFAAYRTTVHRTHLAFLAADTSIREGSSSIWAAGPHSPGIAAARGSDTGALLTAVRAADRRDEVVVVFLHWGVEGRSCPSAAQRGLAHALADAGADVIVGSSAHLLQGAGWLGDTYVDYGLGNFLWYHNGQPDTGVLRVRLVDGRPVSDSWLPGRIPVIGPPVPLHGLDRSQAVARWRGLRSCTGLAARPASAPPLPAYSSSIRRITPAEQHRMRSTHGGRCPTPWSDLRLLSVVYVGFDGRSHRGRVVVAAEHERDVAHVFARLYDARWPLRQVRPVSDYGGDDERSMAADNTSGFNCRTVAGTDRWSDHAFGAALDLNPVENPELGRGSVHPAAGLAHAHLDRTAGATVPAGVIRADGVVVRAFAEIGWEWGGTWSSPDYQHFAAASP
jgi:poly-gamma-glutamate synthesis protein (capsule biosynthesis protein)